MLQSTPFEIRQYPPYLLAEVQMDSNGDGRAFNALAKYIGVFGNPENEGKKPMAMTAPVTLSPRVPLRGEKLAMTSPVVQSEQHMGFVLPFEITKLSDAPKPTDSRVKLRAVPEKVIACRCFSGWYTREAGKAQYKSLQSQLLAENLIPKPSGDPAEEDLGWSVAQYHPPFTLPFLRRNEIWVELNEAAPAVKVLLQKLRAIK